MKRIDAAYHLNNSFQDGNPLTGTRGTRLNATFLNALQEEVIGPIEGYGLTLDPADNSQLYNAIRFAAGGRHVEEFGVTSADTDQTNAFQAALDATAEDGVPLLALGSYRIEGLLDAAGTFRRVGINTLNFYGEGGLRYGTAATDLRWSTISVFRTEIDASATLDAHRLMGECISNDLTFNHVNCNSAGRAVFSMGPDARGYFSTLSGSDWRSKTATAMSRAQIDIVSDSVDFRSWDINVAQMHAGITGGAAPTAPLMRFRCNNPDARFSHLDIRKTAFEKCAAGAVHFHGVQGSSIKDCYIYDAGLYGPITDDLWKFGAGDHLDSRTCTLDNLRRPSASLAAGVHDINLEDADLFAITACGPHSDGVDVTHNFNDAWVEIDATTAIYSTLLGTRRTNGDNAIFFQSPGGPVKMKFADAIPTTGYHDRGTITWNRLANNGAVMGWVCKGAGTPGTQIPFTTIP